MSNSGALDNIRSSSTGHALSATDWLDTHFTWMRPEYEEMLQWVGIKRGWHVLDAASGSGSFLPLMSELVGSEGKIDAIDLAPENISALEKRAAAEKWTTPIIARIGNILNLPYEDGTFDAVWCANTTQYLSDDELRVMLQEFCRVVRPGGLVAVKDYDITLQQIHPTAPTFFQHHTEAILHSRNPEFQSYEYQLFRVVNLPQWLREAGLVELRQKPTFILRLQPISEIGKVFLRDFLKFHLSVVSTLELSEDEREIWRQITDFDSPAHIFNNPDFQYRCIQTVFVGTVPG